MSLIDTDDINPLDWHNTKFLDFIPDHFVRVKFRHNQSRSEVLAWIEQNTVGRYAIAEVIDNEDNATRGFLINEKYQIGFEEPAEATMYTMFFR